MTIKNEKYLPRLKKTAKKKRKIQTEKNTSHTKKMETLKSTSVVRRSKWLSKKEKKSNYEKKWMIKKRITKKWV